MRVDICVREDYETQAALLQAFAQIGAFPEDDFEMEVPLPTGLLHFRVGTEIVTIFVDAWTVDLEGSDELVKQVLASVAGAS